LGDLELGEDRVDGTGLDACVAVDAELRVDVELLRGLEVGIAGLGMDAVGRTDLDARVVLDAAACDDVGHGTFEGTERPTAGAAERTASARRGSLPGRGRTRAGGATPARGA